MAQMETGNTHAHNNKKRSSPLVDLTPMVDLAFLLIAFFMLTTTLQKNTAMDLHMPEKTNDPIGVDPLRLLTLLMDENDLIWYYKADDHRDLTLINNEIELRAVLYQQKQNVEKLFGTEKGLVCLIKLAEGSNYGNMVDVLDEMEITDVPTYAIMDITENEVLSLQEKK